MSSASSSHYHPMQVGPAGSEVDRVVINVGGVRYETCKSTLMSIPGTRLANLLSSDPKHTTSEFFFDRDWATFSPILNYYRTGKLHCPADVCGPTFEEELAFWGISENDMEPCCWTNFRRHRDAEVVRAQLKPDDGPPDYSSVVGGSGRVQSCSDVCMPKLWALFDDPHSSVAAKVIGIISLLFIVTSIIAFSLWTSLWEEPQPPEHDYGNDDASEWDENVNATYHPSKYEVYANVYISLESVCSIFFTIEFLIRLICCPSKKKFILNIMTVIDLLGFLIYYIELFFATEFLYVFLYVARSIRLLRVFKLAGNVPGIQALGLSLRSSVCELILLPVGLCVAILVFSFLAFFAERDSPDSQFNNIYSAFWWAVITLTTVGYGDMYPVTWFGKVVASLCAMTGVFAITMPIVILVTKFAKYYALVEAKQRPLPKTRRGNGHVAVASAPDWKGLENVHP